MRKLHTCLIIAIAFVTASVLHAVSIGFVCIQNSEAPIQAAAFTGRIETELFDVCFDNGLIATSTAELQKGAAVYHNAAQIITHFETIPDYALIVYCEYGQDEQAARKKNTLVSWKQVKWKLIDCASLTAVAENIVNLSQIAESDSIHKARVIGGIIAASVLKLLQ